MADVRPTGTICQTPDGGFAVVTPSGDLAPYAVPDGERAELVALLGLRATLTELREAEASDPPDAQLVDALRQRLNDEYDAYFDQWGPINRVSTRRAGWVVQARIRPAQGGFATDPGAQDVFALEHYDEARNNAVKAEVFTFSERSGTP